MIDPWIQGVTAPTVTVSPWIQGSMVHFTTYVYGGGPPLQLDCKMHHRPLNPGGHCHSWSSDPLNPGVYGTLGFSYQFIYCLGPRLYSAFLRDVVEKKVPNGIVSAKIVLSIPSWT